MLWYWFLFFKFVHFLSLISSIWPASWLSGNAFVSGEEGLGLKSRAGQIERGVANGLQPLQYFFEKSCFAPAQWRRDGSCKLIARFGVKQRV